MAIVVKSNDIKFVKGSLTLIKFEENSTFKIQGASSENSDASILDVKFKSAFQERPNNKEFVDKTQEVSAPISLENIQ